MKKLLASIALMALPAMASAESYKCTTTNYGNGGWVSNLFYFDYDPKTNTATAIDYYINEVHDAPIKVDWKQRSENSYQFNWKVKGVKASNGGGAILSYRFILFKDRMAFSLNGQNHGYENVISARGTCERVG